MIIKDPVDLQSLLSESSSITEEEVIDTKQKISNQESDDDDISEPSQIQKKQAPAPKRGRPRKTKPETKPKKMTSF